VVFAMTRASEVIRRRAKVHPVVERALKQAAPVQKLIGFTLDEIEGGRTVGHLEAGPQHANPMDGLHGGILCDLTDAAMGTAFASTLKPEERFTTIELKINFLRPVRTGRLRAEAKVLKRGRTIGYIECEVTDERERLVAKASSTCMVLGGAHSAGR
jgi:uncharacterized protein (TIGR00369 family)